MGKLDTEPTAPKNDEVWSEGESTDPEEGATSMTGGGKVPPSPTLDKLDPEERKKRLEDPTRWRDVQ